MRCQQQSVRRVLQQQSCGSEAAMCRAPKTKRVFSTVVWLDLKSVFYTRGRTCPSNVHPVAIALANGSGTYIYFRYVGAT